MLISNLKSNDLQGHLERHIYWGNWGHRAPHAYFSSLLSMQVYRAIALFFKYSRLQKVSLLNTELISNHSMFGLEFDYTWTSTSCVPRRQLTICEPHWARETPRRAWAEYRYNKMVNLYNGPAAKLLTPPTLTLVKMTISGHHIVFWWTNSYYDYLILIMMIYSNFDG